MRLAGCVANPAMGRKEGRLSGLSHGILLSIHVCISLSTAQCELKDVIYMIGLSAFPSFLHHSICKYIWD
jgi:hypothetical protein